MKKGRKKLRSKLLIRNLQIYILYHFRSANHEIEEEVEEDESESEE